MTRWVLQYAMLVVVGAAGAYGIVVRMPAELVQGPEGVGGIVIVLLSPFITALSTVRAEFVARTFGRDYHLGESLLLVHCGIPLAIGAVLCSGLYALMTGHPLATATFGIAWLFGAFAGGIIPAVRRIHAEEASLTAECGALESAADAQARINQNLSGRRGT